MVSNDWDNLTEEKKFEAAYAYEPLCFVKLVVELRWRCPEHTQYVSNVSLSKLPLSINSTPVKKSLTDRSSKYQIHPLSKANVITSEFDCPVYWKEKYWNRKLPDVVLEIRVNSTYLEPFLEQDLPKIKHFFKYI